MAVSATGWKRNGARCDVTGRTYADAERQLEALGCYRYVDGLGEVYRWLAGEWVCIGNVSEQDYSCSS